MAKGKGEAVNETEYGIEQIYQIEMNTSNGTKKLAAHQ